MRTVYGSCVTLFFVLFLIYYIAFKTVLFTQAPYERLVTQTKPDFFLAATPANNTDPAEPLKATLSSYSKVFTDYLNGTSTQEQNLEVMRRFQVAFMMQNPFMDRWDYIEANYGKWQVTQVVQKTDQATKLPYLEEVLIPVHKCTDQERQTLLRTMSDSYAKAFTLFNNQALMCLDHWMLQGYQGADPSFGDSVPSLKLAFKSCDSMGTLNCNPASTVRQWLN